LVDCFAARSKCRRAQAPADSTCLRAHLSLSAISRFRAQHAAFNAAANGLQRRESGAHRAARPADAKAAAPSYLAALVGRELVPLGAHYDWGRKGGLFRAPLAFYTGRRALVLDAASETSTASLYGGASLVAGATGPLLLSSGAFTSIYGEHSLVLQTNGYAFMASPTTASPPAVRVVVGRGGAAASPLAGARAWQHPHGDDDVIVLEDTDEEGA
jgi:hypothetical protein